MWYRRRPRRNRRPTGATLALLAALLGALLGALLPGASSAGASLTCPTPAAVTVVSRSGDRGRATAEPKRVRAGAEAEVTLFAVVRDTAGRRWGAAPGVEPWPPACPVTVRWEKVEAVPRSYNNAGSLPAAEIAYAETPWAEGWSVPADVHPTLMHDPYPAVSRGFGVMRFRALVESPAGSVASPGAECRESGAVCRAVHTVARRPDDSYLGYLHELLNTPYIYGSKTIRGGHQSDRLVGSDCADLVVYGLRRRHGERRYPYTYTGGLGRHAARRWKVTLDDAGRYVDRRGRPLTFGPEGELRPGDALNFEEGHVGVLVADDGDGFLDLDDRILHTLVREPEIVPIRDCRWPGIGGKEVLRFP